jgi:hypothetical protein
VKLRPCLIVWLWSAGPDSKWREPGCVAGIAARGGVRRADADDAEQRRRTSDSFVRRCGVGCGIGLQRQPGARGLPRTRRPSCTVARLG